MDRTTGRPLYETAHIKQSVAEILLTPRGSRVERREFGSDIPRLIDRPWSRTLALQLMAATVMALARWEPRVLVRSLVIGAPGQNGATSVDLEMVIRATGQDLSLSVGLRVLA